MGALMRFQPSKDSLSALRELLRKHKNLPPDVKQFLAEISKGEEPMFFFRGAAEFSTQEAADILCVSRQNLIGLLASKKIAFRLVGKHRRVDAVSLMAYKAKQDAENKRITDELTSIAEEFKL